jgi:hypothetical protein
MGRVFGRVSLTGMAKPALENIGKRRYFIYLCVVCTKETAVLASKSAQRPSCCPSGKGMKYLGVRDLAADQVEGQ